MWSGSTTWCTIVTQQNICSTAVRVCFYDDWLRWITSVLRVDICDTVLSWRLPDAQAFRFPAKIRVQVYFWWFLFITNLSSWDMKPHRESSWFVWQIQCWTVRIWLKSMDPHMQWTLSICALSALKGGWPLKGIERKYLYKDWDKGHLVLKSDPKVSIL